MTASQMLSAAFCLFSTNVSFASINPNENLFQASKPLVRDGVFKSQTTVDLEPEMFLDPVTGEKIENLETFTLSQGEAVLVNRQTDGSILLTYVPSEEEAGIDPHQLILNAEQFAQLPLSFDRIGDANTLNEYPQYDIEQYASRRGRYRARSRRHSRRGGRYGGCVAYVASQTGFSGHAGDGVGMASSLKRENGYHDADCNNPQYGDVGSWGGGRRGRHGRYMGDVAIYRGNGLWQYGKNKFHKLHMTGYSLKNCVRPH